VLNVVLAVATPLLFLSLALVCLLRFGLLALALYVGLLTYAYVIALGGKPTLAVRLLDT